MTYEFFLTRLEEKIREWQEEGEKICRVQVLKNNSVKLDGFSYCVEGHKERPTVYVNHYYREDLTEEDLAQTADLTLKTLRECRLFPGRGVDQILNYRRMKDRIFCRLISREKNEELLTQVPWLPWLDLAIVFCLAIPEQIVERASALIHKSHMEGWGITQEELHRAAAENMAKLPVLLEPMETLLEGYGLDVLSSGLYVLSNKRKEYGAAAIIDPAVQRMCYEQLGEDYYVLPSSVHELILLPDSLFTGREELDALIQEVNENCVSQEEYLGSHAYHYSHETGKLE